MRPQTPDLAEFTLRTTSADVVAPDGTAITPGGTTTLYTWDVDTGLPAPRHRFQVQARRPTSASRAAAFVLLSHHDGTTYTRRTSFDGAFTHDSVTWQLDATGNFAAVSGDPQQSLPLTLSVRNTVFLVPGGGSVPGTEPTERQISDRIDAFAYRHAQAVAFAGLEEYFSSGWEEQRVPLPLVRGTGPRDVQRGRYTYTVELPALDPERLRWWSLYVVATFNDYYRELNGDSISVCGWYRTPDCPIYQY